MDELLSLIHKYDPYYEMADNGATWRRGSNIDRRIRTLVAQLRAMGHGREIDALLDEYPNLISCPHGRHALAQ